MNKYYNIGEQLYHEEEELDSVHFGKLEREIGRKNTANLYAGYLASLLINHPKDIYTATKEKQKILEKVIPKFKKQFSIIKRFFAYRFPIEAMRSSLEGKGIDEELFELSKKELSNRRVELGKNYTDVIRILKS